MIKNVTVNQGSVLKVDLGDDVFCYCIRLSGRFYMYVDSKYELLTNSDAKALKKFLKKKRIEYA